MSREVEIIFSWDRSLIFGWGWFVEATLLADQKPRLVLVESSPSEELSFCLDPEGLLGYPDVQEDPPYGFHPSDPWVALADFLANVGES